MEIVDDQRHRRVLGRQRRSEPPQERMVCRPPPRGGRQRPRDGRAGAAQRRGDVGPEDPRLVVVVVQGNPGHRPGFRRRPQRQGHRLARAGGAGDDRQRAPSRALGDQLGDPRPRDRPVRHAGHRDLGCQDQDVSRSRRPPGGGRHLLGSVGRHRDLSASLPAGGAMAAYRWRSHHRCRPGPFARPPWRTLSPPVTTQLPTGPAAHHTNGMKSNLSPFGPQHNP
jgi:hypothetical protein